MPNKSLKAMCNKGVSFGELNKSEEAIKVYDELIGLIAKYGEWEETVIAEKVASAILYKKAVSYKGEKDLSKFNDDLTKTVSQYEKTNPVLVTAIISLLKSMQYDEES